MVVIGQGELQQRGSILDPHDVSPGGSQETGYKRIIKEDGG